MHAAIFETYNGHATSLQINVSNDVQNQMAECVKLYETTTFHGFAHISLDSE